jgi:ribosome-binding protein aMBF1 (putative translation factor)
MRICEVCGRKDVSENKEEKLFQPVRLHVCESCKQDRRMTPLGDWAF